MPTSPAIDTALAWIQPPERRFAFRHAALRRADSVLEWDENREACLKVDLGDVKAAVPLRQVGATLSIAPNDPDAAMLAIAGKALHFVPRIGFDDPIPGEVLDGSPSWVPRPAFLARAARRVARALGDNGDADRFETPTPAALVELLGARLARAGRTPSVADLRDVVGGIARIDFLCRAVIMLQQLAGRLAKAAGTQPSQTTAATARAGALALRQAAIWAGEIAMRADARAADPLRALADPSAFRARAHPEIAALHALTMDARPLLARGTAPNFASAVDVEEIAGLAVRRYARFDPKRFLATAGIAVAVHPRSEP